MLSVQDQAKVKELIGRCDMENDWEDAGGGWQCCESHLRLSGWNRSRRFVLYRRAHVRKAKKDKTAKALEGPCRQGEFEELEVVGENCLKNTEA